MPLAAHFITLTLSAEIMLLAGHESGSSIDGKKAERKKRTTWQDLNSQPFDHEESAQLLSYNSCQVLFKICLQVPCQKINFRKAVSTKKIWALPAVRRFEPGMGG